MKTILILTNGEETEYREIEDLTEYLLINLEDYDNSKDLTDIMIEKEGKPIVQPSTEKQAGVVYVYDNPNAPTLPPKRQPWEMF